MKIRNQKNPPGRRVLLFILICYIIANHFGADIGKSWG